jgi:hypothetical protein
LLEVRAIGRAINDALTKRPHALFQSSESSGESMIIHRGLPGSDVFEQFELPDIEVRTWLTAGIYGLAAWLIDLPTLKVVGLFAIVLFATKYHFGRSTLIRGSVAIAFFGVAVWLGAVNPPAQWRSDIRDFYVSLNSHRLASN